MPGQQLGTRVWAGLATRGLGDSCHGHRPSGENEAKTSHATGEGPEGPQGWGHGDMGVLEELGDGDRRKRGSWGTVGGGKGVQVVPEFGVQGVPG